MSAGRWVLWGRLRGAHPLDLPTEFARGSRPHVNRERRALQDSAERNDGAMPYPFRDYLIVSANESPMPAFRELDSRT